MKHRIAYPLVALAIVALFASMAVQAPLPQAHSTLPSNKFSVMIDGVNHFEMTSVSGLQCTTDVVEFRQGGQTGNNIVLLPGLTRCGPIVLTRQLSGDNTFNSWYEDVKNGNLVRKDIAIRILDNSGAVALQYVAYQTWPMKYEVGPLNSTPAGIAMETTTLAVENIVRDLSVNPPP